MPVVLNAGSIRGLRQELRSSGQLGAICRPAWEVRDEVAALEMEGVLCYSQGKRARLAGQGSQGPRPFQSASTTSTPGQRLHADGAVQDILPMGITTLKTLEPLTLSVIHPNEEHFSPPQTPRRKPIGRPRLRLLRQKPTMLTLGLSS